jgi:hypothetical protein
MTCLSCWHIYCSFLGDDTTSKECPMKSLTQKMRSWLAAVAFAEAGEHETAMEIAGIGPRLAKSPSSVLDAIERTLVAVSFAEEGLHTEAARYIELSGHSKATALEDFLDAVGLHGVQAQYVMARL